jgi:hypothetical protein
VAFSAVVPGFSFPRRYALSIANWRPSQAPRQQRGVREFRQRLARMLRCDSHRVVVFRPPVDAASQKLVPEAVQFDALAIYKKGVADCGECSQKNGKE